MSACEDVKERLCEFLDGELAQADRAAVESHIQDCTACRDELSALREAASAVHALDRRPAPTSILEGVRSGLQQQPRTPETPRDTVRPEPSSWWRPALSAAAVLIVGALIYAAYLPQEHERRSMAADTTSKTKAERTASPAPKAPAVTMPSAPSTETTANAGNSTVEGPPFKHDHAKAGGEDLGLTQPSYDPKEDAVADKRDPDLLEKSERAGPVFKADRVDQLSSTEKPVEVLGEPEPVAQGTPQHIAEGEANPIVKSDVIQKLKDGWIDLSRSRESKPSAEIAQQKEKASADEEVAQIQSTRHENDVLPPTTTLPAAKALSAPSPVVAGKDRDTKLGLEHNENPLGVAKAPGQTAGQMDRELQNKPLVVDDQRQQTAQDRLKQQALPTEDLAKTEVPAVAQQDQAANAPERGQQILTVARKDLPRVMEDLRQLAASSGGELAWSPASQMESLRRTQKQRAVQSGGTAERVLLRVPEARLEELVLATEQYRAQRALNEEVASAREQPEKKAESIALKKVATKGPAQLAEQADKPADEEYVQIVLVIRPQTASAAAEAARTESPANAKIPLNQSKQ